MATVPFDPVSAKLRHSPQVAATDVIIGGVLSYVHVNCVAAVF